jgi:hypothetical protein
VSASRSRRSREPHLLAHFDVIVDGERQRCRGAEDLDVVGDHLDVAGGDARVLVALRPLLDGAGDEQAVLRAQLVGDVLTHHHLHDA